jgi:hypothetical protein
MNAVIEYGVIGFGIIGAVVAGNAVSEAVKRSGGSSTEQLALGCVASGLSVAVLPAAAVAGVAATCRKGYELYGSERFKLHVAEAKAKTLGTMNQVVNGKELGRSRKPTRLQAAK